MLTEVLRQALARVPNRFHLAVLAAERSAQLLQGARPAVENPNRERVMKIALREIGEEKIERTGDDNLAWRVERPPSVLDQVFNLGVPGSGDHELMALAEDLEAAARDEGDGDGGEDEDGEEE